MISSAVIGPSHLLYEKSRFDLIFVDPVLKVHDRVGQETLGTDAPVFVQTNGHDSGHSLTLESLVNGLHERTLLKLSFAR